MHPLGSGVDRETDIRAASQPADDSTENILMPIGITKQTDVVVSRQHAPSSNESL